MYICVYVYMCMCISVYKCICIYIYIYIYIYISTNFAYRLLIIMLVSTVDYHVYSFMTFLRPFSPFLFLTSTFLPVFNEFSSSLTLVRPL